MEYPLIIVNLKTYREATGAEAYRMACIANRVSEATGVAVAVAPQHADCRLASAGARLVFAQHVDAAGVGQFTGHVLPEAMAAAGCSGTLLNHSERQLPLAVLEATVKRAREAGLVTVVCADTVEKVRTVAAFKPDAVAVEPPELIGSGVSVSKARPEVISGAVQAVKSVNPSVRVLCGAGITNGTDVSIAARLGAEGILVASGVVKARDPEAALLDLARSLA
jgi:triosephosphate isomerase